MSSLDWKASAAYLYALHLSPAHLAWEYLRRNPAYRAAWTCGTSSDFAALWGLQFRRESFA